VLRGEVGRAVGDGVVVRFARLGKAASEFLASERWQGLLWRSFEMQERLLLLERVIRRACGET
jgi:hypothetical protein